MLETPQKLANIAPRRLSGAFIGLVALALLHLSGVAHQFEHSADHDLGVCAACAAYSQLEYITAPCAPGEKIVVAPFRLQANRSAAAFEIPVSATYRSRAPPLS